MSTILEKIESYLTEKKTKKKKPLLNKWAKNVLKSINRVLINLDDKVIHAEKTSSKNNYKAMYKLVKGFEDSLRKDGVLTPDQKTAFFNISKYNWEKRKVKGK